jgi:glycine betaine/proline transport system substrate-binding protein
VRKHLKIWAFIGAVVFAFSLMAGCGAEEAPTASFGGRIVGIEPGAGIMQATEKAIEVYGLDFELQDSSSFAMAAALRSAIENGEWIVVTGWSPHWKFAVYDLKYLEDPEGVYGGAETINTIVRKGLEEDDPALFAFLDNFLWGPEDIGMVMLDVSEGVDPWEAARKWVDENADKVAVWTEGIEFPEGGKAHLAFVEWDCAIASTHVVATVLQDLGYDVEITSVDAGIMWQGIATGSFDAMTTAWLPHTHSGYWAEVGDQVVDLGPNYDGEAKIGLVVPAYVTIDSITEMNDYR